ncbi:UPAR/Ly6 domain-containing protein rtv [Battus philenor]|uniref:UPAR/Ly6 domain-containing protein rtv n=1 Tax=Battus philenor TaxID=42288 RepID=UPI0035D0E62A
MDCKVLFLCSLVGFLLLKEASCLNKRCIRCRSRGELGSCGDPFPFNVTEPEVEMGIHVVACPSGWCGKSYEGNIGAFKNDDYGAATERMCLQRAPSDYEERCAYTMWGHRKVYMCFCNGDLCNSAVKITSLQTATLLTILLVLYNYCYF